MEVAEEPGTEHGRAEAAASLCASAVSRRGDRPESRRAERGRERAGESECVVRPAVGTSGSYQSKSERKET
jgi:hypothetical protein